jgi:hypothetical protein
LAKGGREGFYKDFQAAKVLPEVELLDRFDYDFFAFCMESYEKGASRQIKNGKDFGLFIFFTPTHRLFG